MPHDELLNRVRRLCSPKRARLTNVTPRLPKLRGIRAVLFDVYGTLLISGAGEPGGMTADGGGRRLRAALKACGARALSRRAGSDGLAFLREGVSKRHAAAHEAGVEWPEVDILAIWRSVLSRLVKAGLVETIIDGATIKTLAVEYECRSNPVWPMPGTARVLRRLGAAGIHLGVVSNAQFFTPLIFEAFFPGGLSTLGIQRSLCAWSWKCGAAKPSTTLFRFAMDRLQEVCPCTPSEILVVGNDMLNDVATAARLGCRTALFAGDARSLRTRESHPDCHGVRPDAVITRLEQLTRILL